MGEGLNYPIAKVLFMAIFRSPGWRIWQLYCNQTITLIILGTMSLSMGN